MKNLLSTQEKMSFKNIVLGKKPILTFVLIYCSVFFLQAQQIKEVDEFFKENGIEYEDQLHKLVYGAVPSIYISNNSKVNPSGSSPLMLSVDASSLGALNDSDESYGTVKIIKIKISYASQLASMSLQPSFFKDFTELNYLYILSEVPMSLQDVSRISSALADSGFMIFYKVAIPQ